MTAPTAHTPVQLEKQLYTASVSVTGGRSGRITSDDGVLDVAVAPPKEMGGPGGAANPELLFAAGYAACYQSALGGVARREGVDASASVVEADVTIGPINFCAGYGLAVALRVSIPGVDDATAQRLADAAHQVCPYSNATRGNIEVDITVV